MDNKIIDWIIDLQGGPHDLNDCAKLFERGTEIRVEREQSGDSIPRYNLHSSEFKGIADTQIHSVAATMIAKMNEAVKSRGGTGAVMMGIPVTIRADGTRIPMKVVTAVSSMPNESLAAAASTHSMPVENLTSVASTSSAPIAHLASVASTSSAPIETLSSFSRKVFQKYWPALCWYFLFIIVGWFCSYFLSSWPSVGAAIILNIITFVVGLYAITTTYEIVTEIQPVRFRKWLFYMLDDLRRLIRGGH
jgi:hypothetical protein